MCLAVVRENLLHFRVELDTVLFAGLFDNMPASERLYGSFQQLIGLELNDDEKMAMEETVAIKRKEDPFWGM